MNHRIEDGQGNVLKDSVDNGDGTYTVTVYGEGGVVITSETISGVPTPPLESTDEIAELRELVDSLLTIIEGVT